MLAIFILLVTYGNANTAQAPYAQATTQVVSAEDEEPSKPKPEPEPEPEKDPCPAFGVDAQNPYQGGIECVKEMAGAWGGQCVMFVKYLLGYDKDFHGHAAEIQPNSDHPEVGQVVLLAGTKWEHVAVITDISKEAITIIESNWHGDERIVVGRQVPLDSWQIRGYYHYAQQEEATSTELVLE